MTVTPELDLATMSGTTSDLDPRTVLVLVGLLLAVAAGRALLVLMALIRQVIRTLGLLLLSLGLVAVLAQQMYRSPEVGASTPGPASVPSAGIPALGSFAPK